MNLMASNLTSPGGAQHRRRDHRGGHAGDLSKKITVDVKGEILELKNTINTMVDQLRSFASEVTRWPERVGTEGKLGGQADVKGVAGTWKDLTDNVNLMASNLTGPGASTSPKSRRLLPAATSPRRSRWMSKARYWN